MFLSQIGKYSSGFIRLGIFFFYNQLMSSLFGFFFILWGFFCLYRIKRFDLRGLFLLIEFFYLFLSLFRQFLFGQGFRGGYVRIRIFSRWFVCFLIYEFFILVKVKSFEIFLYFVFFLKVWVVRFLGFFYVYLCMDDRKFGNDIE